MIIRILTTGGTFDKEYNELTGELYFKDTHVNEMLTLGRNRVTVVIQTLFMMDSLQMQDAHREEIANCCINASENHIIVTHGTDTMPETARLLDQKGIGKTIVLTGAMIPYKFGSSAGLFYHEAWHTCSCLCVDCLCPTVYYKSVDTERD